MPKKGNAVESNQASSDHGAFKSASQPQKTSDFSSVPSVFQDFWFCFWFCLTPPAEAGNFGFPAPPIRVAK